MKKLFFILAAAVALAACNPTTPEEPEEPIEPQQDTAFAENIIYNQFNDLLPLVGMQLADAQSALVSKGWTNYENSGIFVLITDFSMSQVNFVCNASDVVKDITCSISPYTVTPATYEPQMYCNYIKDAVKKIDYNFVMGQAMKTCRFYATYNQIGAKWCSSPQDFESYINDGNLDATNTIYLDATIQTWTKESGAPFTGVQMGVRKTTPIEGVTINEYSVAFDFKDETIE